MLSILFLIFNMFLFSLLLFQNDISQLFNKWGQYSDSTIVNKQIDELERKQKIERGEPIDQEIKEKKENQVQFFADINFNDPDPIILKPGEELEIFKRIVDDTNLLPGAGEDVWHFNSLRFTGEINYQLLITTKGNNNKTITKHDLSNTGIENIINWLTYDIPEKDIFNDSNRRSIIFRINKDYDNVSGTGIPDINAILYTGVGYEADESLTNLEYRYPMNKDESVKICKIESKFRRLPTGEYDRYEDGSIKMNVYQKTEWYYKSMKIQKGTTIELTVEEENPEKDDVTVKSFLYTIDYNIPNLIVWLEIKNQDQVKYSPYYPVNTERIYYVKVV